MDSFLSESFAARVEELMKKHSVPGLSMAVVQGSRTASKAYGLASVNPPVECTTDTLFCIASCSKSLTAGSVALLVDDNDKYPEVQWDAKMSELLPDDFVMAKKDYTDDITVDDVIGHRTGLPRHDLSYLGPKAVNPDTPQSVTRNLRNLALAAPLRSKHMYNNMMYTVASYLVEVKSGKSFSAFLREEIFNPLGMDRSFLQASSVPDEHRHLLAKPYEWDEETKEYREALLPEGPESQGAGFIITSSHDLIKWVEALMSRKEPVNDNIYDGLLTLRSFSQDDDEKPRKFASPMFYCAGLEIYYYRGHTIVGHGGSDPGFGAYHFFIPGLDFGGALMGNSGNATKLTEIIACELIDDALHIPANEREDPDKMIEDDEDDKNDGKETPLPHHSDEYIGTYHNQGYHSMVVRVQNQRLYVDASDRAMGFTATMRHIEGGTEFIADAIDSADGSKRSVKVRFVRDGEVVSRFGIDLEPDLGEFIWFDRAD